jgi:hypothetical protein
MARKHAHIYSDPQWPKLKAQVYEEESDCRICGRYVDRRYRSPHPMSGSVHHLVDLNLGGDPFDRDNVGLTHYGCNSRLGAQQGHATQQAKRASAQVIRGTRVHIPVSQL